MPGCIFRRCQGRRGCNGRLVPAGTGTSGGERREQEASEACFFEIQISPPFIGRCQDLAL